jgi:hypothetical protein
MLTAIALDVVVLSAFAAMKWQSDPLIVVLGVIGMGIAFFVVGIFLARNPVSVGGATALINECIKSQSLDTAGGNN